MKVLWFTNNPCGATEKLTGKKVISGGWLYALSKYIANERNVELHIAFYWNENVEPFEYDGVFYHPMQRKGCKNKYTRLITRYKRIYGIDEDTEEIKVFDRVINSVSPDIIHIHGTEENFSLLHTFNPACPIVVSIQGLISPYLYKFYSGFAKKDIVKYEKIFRKLAGLGINSIEKLYHIKAHNEVESLKYIPNIIGRTFWDKACTLAINPERKYFEVGEIIRNEFYENQWAKTSFSNPLKLVTTVSGGWYKGLETIFSSADILNKAHIKFEWNVIGISKNDPITKLSEKITRKSPEVLNINLLGRKTSDEMVNVMQSSDIFVQVSHIENSPNSLCEAMLLGMPIIATFAGGTASLLCDGEEGLLIQDGDPYVMAGMIIELSKNFQKAKDMGNKAAKVAAKRHEPELVVRQLLCAYQTILNEGNN